MPSFAFFYFMKPAPDRIREIAPIHGKYWESLELPGYQGGPFGDHSGGIITFEAANLEEAQSLANEDPFIVEKLLDQRWLKEWVIQ